MCMPHVALLWHIWCVYTMNRVSPRFCKPPTVEGTTILHAELFWGCNEPHMKDLLPMQLMNYSVTVKKGLICWHLRSFK